MKGILFYLAQVMLASGTCYLYYHLFLRNKKFHSYNRYFLLATLVISISIPFFKIPVNVDVHEIRPAALLKTLAVISSGKFENEPSQIDTHAGWQSVVTSGNVLIALYCLFMFVLLCRFTMGILKISRLTKKYPNEKIENITFINTDEPGTPFSFFRLLFWNRKITLNSSQGQQILRHELFHIHQKHSYDIIFIELLSSVFWINPFFALIRKELKIIHEFLADESAVNKHEEWRYAELLLMQVLGSPNNRLTTPFFHNQIKRRITMITSSHQTKKKYLRKLFVLPVLMLLVGLFAFKYHSKENIKSTDVYFARPITVIIDAGHDENTGSVASDGTRESDIVLSLAKKIKALNTNENIRVVLTRNSKEAVDLKQRSELANALHPDLFISLHLNNAMNNEKKVDNTQSGFDVFISRKNPLFSAENRIFGGILLNSFAGLLPVEKSILQRSEGIWVLDNSACPAVLIECGYLSNEKDLAFVKQAANQQKIAEKVLNSIQTYAHEIETPDFKDRLHQAGDSTLPGLKLIKDNGGKK